MTISEKIFALKILVENDVFSMIVKNIADDIDHQGNDTIYIYNDGSAITNLNGESFVISNEHYEQLNSDNND